MKIIQVIADSDCKAKPINGKGKRLPIWWTTKFPKAMKQMERAKRIGGTKWNAIIVNDKVMGRSYNAVSRIFIH